MNSKVEAQPIKITSAAEWRKPYESGVPFHFPSGLVAQVRPVNIDTFVKLGQIPDILTEIVSKLITGRGTEDMGVQDYQRAAEVYDIFCKTCFISPKVVDEIKDPEHEITADMIADTDKQTLFTFLGAPASTLASFRPVEANLVADLVSQPRNPSSAQ